MMKYQKVMVTYINRYAALPEARKQQGNVLFMGLIILLVLAVLGVASMQSTMLQERMSGNYKYTAMALMNAERRLGIVERNIYDQVKSSTFYFADIFDCNEDFTSATFSAGGLQDQNVWTKEITGCIIGGNQVDPTVKVYEVAVQGQDSETLSNADAVVSAIYIP